MIDDNNNCTLYSAKHILSLFQSHSSPETCLVWVTLSSVGLMIIKTPIIQTNVKVTLTRKASSTDSYHEKK